MLRDYETLWIIYWLIGRADKTQPILCQDCYFWPLSEKGPPAFYIPPEKLQKRKLGMVRAN